ncbi:MAG: ribonuclease PH [Dehalococcoidia bacterium]|nr:ribonuclease PH [Dehalococcoidia bacterium]
MPRIDGRHGDELRPVKVTPGFLSFAEGSVLIEMGLTRVVCTVSVQERIPSFISRGSGNGWVTAEYSMLPRATHTRNNRGVSPRSQEIQRLIGRSLRSVVDMKVLGEMTLVVDCDVIQADGGTRCASITGAYVALYQAVQGMLRTVFLNGSPLRGSVAAVRVGVVGGEPMLDLCYDEDSRADVDFNIVMTNQGDMVEVQGTAEGRPFPRATLDSLLSLAGRGIGELLQVQRSAIEGLK